jgi:hypothetical protein
MGFHVREKMSAERNHLHDACGNDETRDCGSRSPRRGRPRANAGERVRYFIPKSGSSAEKPELGQEVASEGEALVEAFKSGQLFYALIAWKAVPKMDGNEARIVKQSASRT